VAPHVGEPDQRTVSTRCTVSAPSRWY
jgi:hypothetical protein